MKKNFGSKLYFIPAIFIVALVFNLLVFILKEDNYTSTFWVTYGFVMFGFVWFLLSSLFAQDKKTGVAYIHPTVTIAGLFWIITFVFAIIFLWFPKAPVKVVLIPIILLTGIMAVVYIFALMNKAIVARENAPKPYMQKIEDVYNVLTSIHAKTNDPSLRSALEEVMRLAMNASAFTDPKHDALDKRIFEYVQFINKNVERGEMNNVFNNINKLKSLLIERSKIVTKN